MGILGPPYCGIGATIRIGREMLCLPYAGFFGTKFRGGQNVLFTIGGFPNERDCSGAD